MLFAAALALASFTSPAAKVIAPCTAPVKAALAFVDDSEPLAEAAVEQALARGCFDIVEVKAGSDEAMLKDAREQNAPWLVVARAGLAMAVEDKSSSGNVFSIDLTAFDTSSAERRGRAMRSANLLGHDQRATGSREATRVVDDAVRVLKNQIAHPAEPEGRAVSASITSVDVEQQACTSKTSIVLLWSKASDAAGKDAVLKALAARCIDAPDQFDSDRAGAMEFARDLKRPMLAVKTSITRPAGAVVSHVLTISVDVVDANSEQLKVLAHAQDTRNAMRASDDADAWSKVESSLVDHVLAQVLPTP